MDVLWFTGNRCSDILDTGTGHAGRGYGLQGIAARIY